jgi:glycosyltransferase involved in cell wall biosynthesis
MKNVTCAIVTLNEQKNIIDCINSIRKLGDFQIRVYDGGSTDDTVAIVKGMGVAIIEIPGTSLSYRRQIAADESDSEFIFYVDADHRVHSLKGKFDWILKKYFDKPAVAGIMFRKESDLTDYWSRGFYYRGELFLNQTKNPKVIGMPCIFRTQLVKTVRFHEFATGSIDDTLLCTRLGEQGYTFCITDEYVIERFRASFGLTKKKAFWYGLGDAEFVRINVGSLRRRHIFHVLVRNLFIHPIISLIRRPLYFPFFCSFGISRAMGFGWGLIHKEDMSSLKS